MRRRIALLLLASAMSCAAQTRINPATQINWPQTTGAGGPSGSCTSTNYGQPYTDVTNDHQYFCMSPRHGSK